MGRVVSGAWLVVLRHMGIDRFDQSVSSSGLVVVAASGIRGRVDLVRSDMQRTRGPVWNVVGLCGTQENYANFCNEQVVLSKVFMNFFAEFVRSKRSHRDFHWNSERITDILACMADPVFILQHFFYIYILV